MASAAALFVVHCLLLLRTMEAPFEAAADSSGLRQCQQSDFRYEYTECDQHGGRWRVAVPREPNLCVGGQPAAPIRGPDCTLICPSGSHLDAVTQKCQPCPPGTYSLGGAVRYDQFESALPAGFQTLLQPAPLNTFAEPDDHQPASAYCRNGSGWQAANNQLVYAPGAGDACLAMLTYTTTLVRPGRVRYKYQYPDAGVFFAFQIQNEQCVNVVGDTAAYDRHTLPTLTTETTWRQEEVKLSPGQLLLSWKAMVLHGQHGAVKVKDIEVEGVAYAQRCSKCPAGTFSSAQAAATCQPCPAGFYSLAGATNCSACNNLTEYSGIRASNCTQRPPCTLSDYYALYGPCNVDGRSKIEYRWIEPKICRDDRPDAIRLPETGRLIQCPPCNPGSEMQNGRCRFCPRNHYSSGIGACKQCPPNTAPDRAYTFLWWNAMPEQLKSSCQRMDNSECDVQQGWLPLDQRTATTRSRHADLYITLSLTVTGFKSVAPAGGRALGTVSFVFETVCLADCLFYFIEMPFGLAGKPSILGEWSGSVSKRLFTFDADSANQTLFQWVFVKSQSAAAAADVSTDQAFIYSINVTNTVDGGASRCVQCPRNVVTQECIACPAGQYLDVVNGSCLQCPRGTFLAAHGACQSCGPSTDSLDGVECTMDCGRLLVGNRTYNLTPIGGHYQAHGVQIFSRDGTRYYHSFNVTLCTKIKSRCTDTVQQQQGVDQSQQPTTVVSSVCKVTVLPTDKATLFMNPMNIGSRLLGVTDQPSSSFFAVPGGNDVVGPWQYSRLFLYYSSPVLTRSCTNGSKTLLVLQCDPAAQKPTSSLPSSCPDGTCDGCLYQLVISSKYACPICGPDDFQQIVGQCSNGVQTVHRIPGKHCVLLSATTTTTTTLRCSEISTRMQAAVGAATAFGFLLFVLTLVVWKKNQRLEYKYMKLAETRSEGAKLAAADTCGLADGDDDPAAQTMAAVGINRIVFLNSKRRNKHQRSENGFENVALQSDD